MAGKGPPKTPDAILRLRGSARAGSGANEPQSLSVAPPAPGWLPASARAIWPTVANILVGLGMMATEYSIAIGALCESVATWLELTEKIQANPDDHEVRRLQVEARRQMLLLLKEFGLTAAAIKSVTVSKTEIDPLDEFRNPD